MELAALPRETVQALLRYRLPDLVSDAVLEFAEQQLRAQRELLEAEHKRVRAMTMSGAGTRP